METGDERMDKTYAVGKSLELVKKSKIAMLGTVDEQENPNIKAMLNLEVEDLKKIWFSTNTSSKRVFQLLKNNKACVYYVDEDNFMGLMLVGTVEVLQDVDSRKKLWFDGCEKYYPKGINDPDYSVLCFTADRANFYHGLANIDFEVK